MEKQSDLKSSKERHRDPMFTQAARLPPILDEGAVQPQAERPGKKKKTSKLQVLAGFLALGIAGFFGSHIIYNLFWFESTDDAFLKAHIHTISSRESGYVQEVYVDDNQIVHKGELLVRLDPNDAGLQVREAQASSQKARKDVGRFKPYMSEADAMDQKLYDEYEANSLVNNARLSRAQLLYDYTRVAAPSDGKIGRRNVEVGDQIQLGQPLMALVEMHPWVEANFKESQLKHLRLGQAVEIRIDAIPNHVFGGKIDSIAPGSGSTFSLLPPDNATGNFVKIVQRVPVKVVFDTESVRGFEDRLVPGMSSEVKVPVE